MRSEDFEAFGRLMADLCLAFDKPSSPDLVRVFAESLKDVPFHDVKRLAEQHKRTGKKFPSPGVLRPERVSALPSAPKAAEPEMSSWAIAANRILFSVAYQGHRGMTAMGDRLPKAVAVKSDIVQRAESDANAGQPWETQEFNIMCRQAFQQVLA